MVKKNAPRANREVLPESKETTCPADGTPDTPILRLFMQLRAKRDWINSQEVLGEEAFNSLSEELTALEDEIMRLPVTCAADFAAKLISDFADGGVFSDWETGQIWREARALTGTGI